MTKNVGVRSEDHDGRDRVTKNVGDVGARSEQGRNIVTVTKNVGDVGAGSEISWSNVTVTKKLGAGRSRVGARSEQNMIHDNHGHRMQRVVVAANDLVTLRWWGVVVAVHEVCHVVQVVIKWT